MSHTDCCILLLATSLAELLGGFITTPQLVFVSSLLLITMAPKSKSKGKKANGAKVSVPSMKQAKKAAKHKQVQCMCNACTGLGPKQLKKKTQPVVKI